MFHTGQYIQKIKKHYVLKIIFVISLMMASLFIPVNAQSTSEFGHKLLPEKLLENTVGDLQVYVISNDMMVPTSIKNLTVISSDTDIIEILEVSQDSETFIKNVNSKIRTDPKIIIFSIQQRINPIIINCRIIIITHQIVIKFICGEIKFE